MTSHGSWNRAPFPMAGYNIIFQPVVKGKNTGPNEVFADGFKGMEPLKSPDLAARAAERHVRRPRRDAVHH